jgi:hypothetical protein
MNGDIDQDVKQNVDDPLSSAGFTPWSSDASATETHTLGMMAKGPEPQVQQANKEEDGSSAALLQIPHRIQIRY